MKKLLLLFITIPFILASCGSDDDKDSFNNILNGTTWTRHVPESSFDYEMDEKFTFSESTGIYYITQKEDGKVLFNEELDFSYEFISDKKIRLSVFEETSEAVIEGRKMMFLTGYEDEQPIFTKQ